MDYSIVEYEVNGRKIAKVKFECSNCGIELLKPKKYLKVLFDNQSKEAKVLNYKGIEMTLPIEKLEMVIKDLNDLKWWIERYDTIESFLYE